MANVNFFSPDGGTTRYPLEDTEGRTTYEEEIHGVNLLKVTASTQTVSGVTFTVNNDGTITVNGTASANAILDLFSMTKEQYYKAFGERDLILNGCPSGGDPSGHSVDWSKYHLGIIETQNTANTALTDGGDGVTIPASWFASATHNINLRIRISSGQTVSNLVFRPMIRKADIDDPTYRPYNPQAIQNQLNAQGVLGAKNLLEVVATSQTVNGVTFTINRDSNGNVLNVTVNGTASANTECNLCSTTDYTSQLIPEGDYIISDGGVGASNNARLNVARRKGASGTTNNIAVYGDTPIKVNYSEYDYYKIIIWMPSGAIANNLVFKPMLRLASDPDDTYQPYTMTNRELTEIATQTESVTLQRNTSNTTGADIKLFRYGKLRILTGFIAPTVEDATQADEHLMLASNLSSNDQPQDFARGLLGRMGIIAGIVIVYADGKIQFASNTTQNVYFNITWIAK